MKKYIVPILAVIAIAGLAAYALYLGHDGVLLAGVFAILAGLGGYSVRKKPPG